MKTEEADGGMGVLSAPNEPKDLSLATAIWSRHVVARFFTITNDIRSHWFHFPFQFIYPLPSSGVLGMGGCDWLDGTYSDPRTEIVGKTMQRGGRTISIQQSLGKRLYFF